MTLFEDRFYKITIIWLWVSQKFSSVCHVWKCNYKYALISLECNLRIDSEAFASKGLAQQRNWHANSIIVFWRHTGRRNIPSTSWDHFKCSLMTKALDFSARVKETNNACLILNMLFISNKIIYWSTVMVVQHSSSGGLSWTLRGRPQLLDKVFLGLSILPSASTPSSHGAKGSTDFSALGATPQTRFLPTKSI